MNILALTPVIKESLAKANDNPLPMADLYREDRQTLIKQLELEVGQYNVIHSRNRKDQAPPLANGFESERRRRKKILHLYRLLDAVNIVIAMHEPKQGGTA